MQWLSMKVPVVSRRDLSIALQRVDLEDGAALISTASVLNKRCPARSGHQRARLVLGGWHFKPLSESECGVHWVSVLDLALTVPLSVLAMGGPFRNKQVVAMMKRMKQLAEGARS